MDFLLIADPKIWQISVEECLEPLVDLRELNYHIKPDRAKFYAGFTNVRKGVAERLNLARRSLPPGYDFYFSEGHRPISLQRQMFLEYYQQLAHAHPDWSDKRLRDETTIYIAPPQDVPPHSTGGAFDITLIDANHKEVNMGSILDETPDKNENRNFTYAPNISGEAKANRAILIKALSQAGFVNYPAEWWHWSYGDKYWAYHVKAPYAIYASIEA